MLSEIYQDIQSDMSHDGTVTNFLSLPLDALVKIKIERSTRLTRDDCDTEKRVTYIISILFVLRVPHWAMIV